MVPLTLLTQTSVLLSNMATPQLLAVFFSTLKLVFPVGKGQKEKTAVGAFENGTERGTDRYGSWVAHPRGRVGHDE